MNQLMLELYQQALEFAYKNISKESWNTDNFHAVVSGKFGELIVAECARIARNTDLEDVEGGDSAVLQAAGEQIEKHFGVES